MNWVYLVCTLLVEWSHAAFTNISAADLPGATRLFEMGAIPYLQCDSNIVWCLSGNIKSLFLTTLQSSQDLSPILHQLTSLTSFNVNQSHVNLSSLPPGVTALGIVNSTVTSLSLTQLAPTITILRLTNSTLDNIHVQILSMNASSVNIERIALSGILPSFTCLPNIGKIFPFTITHTLYTDMRACSAFGNKTTLFTHNPIRCAPWNTSLSPTIQGPIRCNEHPVSATCSGHGTCYNQEEYAAVPSIASRITPCLDPTLQAMGVRPSFACICDQQPNEHWVGILCETCNATLASVQTDDNGTLRCLRDYNILPPQCTTTTCHTHGICVQDNVCQCKDGWIGNGVDFCTVGLFVNVNLAFELLPFLPDGNATSVVMDNITHTLVFNGTEQELMLELLWHNLLQDTLVITAANASSGLNNTGQLQLQLQQVQPQTLVWNGTNQTFILTCNILSPDTTWNMFTTSALTLATYLQTQYQILYQSNVTQPLQGIWASAFVVPLVPRISTVPPGNNNNNNNSSSAPNTSEPTDNTSIPIVGIAHTPLSTNYSLLDMLPLWGLAVVVLSLALLLAGLGWYTRRKWPHANNTLLISILLQLLDILLDWFIVRHLLTETKPDSLERNIGYGYMMSLLVPLLLNASVLMYLLHQELDENKLLREWITHKTQPKNRTVLSLSFFMGLFSTRNATLMTSDWFGLSVFAAPLRAACVDKMMMLSSITTLTEDVVQCVLILMLASNTATQTSNTLGLSLLLNLLTLLATCVKHGIDYCVVHTRTRHASMDGPTTIETNHVPVTITSLPSIDLNHDEP